MSKMEDKGYLLRLLSLAVLSWTLLRMNGFMATTYARDNTLDHKVLSTFKAYDTYVLDGNGTRDIVSPRTAYHGRERFWIFPHVHAIRVLDEPDYSDCHGVNAQFVIFVHSRPDALQKRNLIRLTWANATYYLGIKTYAFLKPVVVFTVGINASDSWNDQIARTKSENKEFNDVLFLSMMDTYDNLTAKSLLTMRWIKSRFPSARYVYKTDDDIILNVYSWMAIIHELDRLQKKCFIVGLVWQNSPIYRTSKYGLTKEQYKPDVFPSFCSGSGYLMSRDAMTSILQLAMYIPSLPRDDPYVTGMLVEAANVRLFAVHDANYKFSPNWYRRNVAKNALLGHGLVTWEWHLVWNRFVYYGKSSKPLTTEIEYVPSRTAPFVSDNDSYYPVAGNKLGVCRYEVHNAREKIEISL